MFLESLQLPLLSSTPHCPSLPGALPVSPLAPAISVTVGRGIFPGPSSNPSIPSAAWQSSLLGEPYPRPDEAPPHPIPPSFPGATLLLCRLCPHTFRLLRLLCILSSCLEAYSHPRCSPLGGTSRLCFGLTGVSVCHPVSGEHPESVRWVLTPWGVAVCPWISHTPFRVSF